MVRSFRVEARNDGGFAMRKLFWGTAAFALLAAGASLQPARAQATSSPEQTAAIAAKLNYMDVGGIKLGMPVKDAVASLKKVMASPEILTTAIVPAFTKPADAPKGKEQITATAKNADGNTEVIELLSTLAPNPELVRSIKLKRNYVNGSGPDFDATLAELRKKYGPESLLIAQGSSEQFNTIELRWDFDPDGHALQGDTARKEWNCTEGGDNGGPACPTLTALEVLVQADGVKKVNTLTEEVRSYPLDRSAEESSASASR
jgi:hypothetical protein